MNECKKKDKKLNKTVIVIVMIKRSEQTNKSFKE